MDHPAPQFDKELQVIEKARKALAEARDDTLAGPLGELVEEYEVLLGRTRRVADLAASVQEDLEAAMDQVAQLSQVDGLTGAMNRRAFEKLLSRDWAQAQREVSALSMLVVNVDLFRIFNELYGSLRADDCLKSVAQAVMRCLYREVDVVARMEGDTFVVLLPGAEPQGARVVAERIQKEVSALEIPHLESPHGGVVTVSVGLSTARPSRGDAPMRLVRQAQAALGQAKDLGRNCLAIQG
jgi:diguanylate cyclase (GGDEF)-like protein